MSGFVATGLPAASGAFTLSELFAADTQLASGLSPQTEAVSFQQLSLVARGNTIALTDAATIDVDLSKGSLFSVTLGGNRTFTFSKPTPGQVFDIEITQDGTGSRTVTWPATATWAGGTAPTLTTTAARTDKITFTYNGAAVKYRGASSLDVR